MKKILKKIIFIAAVFSAASIVVSCNDFLDRESSTVFTDDEIFSDKTMIQSVLANFHGNIDHGPTLENRKELGYLDEAAQYEPNTSTTYSSVLWREYPYTTIRNMNIFMQSLANTKVLSEAERTQYIAEMRVLRAWEYFCMARSLGGMPIIGDKVYSADESPESMRLPRSTESEIYDYIIHECAEAAKVLTSNTGTATHCSGINRWVALSIKARAAIYAGSIAKYNNLVTPQIKTEGGEVGIPAEMAEKYYKIAKETTKEIIDSKKYALYEKEEDPAYNFYRASIDKNSNPEVIWAKDYLYPNLINGWSASAVPTVLALTMTNNEITPLLNLVESYEMIDGSDPKIQTKTANGQYVFYDSPSDPFKGRDPRLHGTVICPGDNFLGTTVEYQAGQLQQSGSRWKKIVKAAGSVDTDGTTITSENGPEPSSSSWWTNKTGFNFCKFVEDKVELRDPSHGGEIWQIRFRYAETLLIYAEACLELGEESEGLPYINMIRNRAGLKDLTSYNIRSIEQERRVEFPLENHRWWDLKRWRRAHIVWDGTSDESTQWALFPYLIKDRRSSYNGKWVFEKVPCPSMLNARTFSYSNYYSYLDNNWLKNNPLLVKNPYQ